VPEKQAVRITEDNYTSQDSGLRVLKREDYLTCCEGTFDVTNDKQAGGVILRLSRWITRVFGLLVTIVIKIVSRLNRFGSYEIDEKVMEAGRNYHHNSRIQNMTH
jgi:hypothetical protein